MSDLDVDAIRAAVWDASQEVGWARLSKETGVPEGTLANFGGGRVARPRGEALQLLRAWYRDRSKAPGSRADRSPRRAVDETSRPAAHATSIEAGYLSQLRYASAGFARAMGSGAARDAHRDRMGRSAFESMHMLTVLAASWSAEWRKLVDRARRLEEFAAIAAFAVEERELERPTITEALDPATYLMKVDGPIFNVLGAAANEQHSQVYWYGAERETVAIIECISLHEG